jgi:hypothetical protein
VHDDLVREKGVLDPSLQNLRAGDHVHGALSIWPPNLERNRLWKRWKLWKRAGSVIRPIANAGPGDLLPFVGTVCKKRG